MSIQSNHSLPAIDAAQVTEILTEFIRDQTRRLQRHGATIGLSGGLDSAVAAALSARALGKDNVFGLILPERDSHPKSKTDAVELAKQLGIRYRTTDITKLIRELGVYNLFPSAFFMPSWAQEKAVRKVHDAMGRKHGKRPYLRTLLGMPDRITRRATAYYRAKNRLRTVAIYYAAEQKNHIVVGTSNKSEYMVGYFVKWGDGAADIMPMLDLYKTQVFQLAEYLGIPQAILEKQPSPDLIPGITDEFALGIPYERLDAILYRLELGLGMEQIAGELETDLEEVDHVMEMCRNSYHMREMPPYPPIAGN